MRKLSICLMLVFVMSISAQELKTHVIQKGETVESIAAKYRVNVEDIKKLNPYVIGYYAGVKLKIPVRATNDVFVNTDSINVEPPLSNDCNHLDQRDYDRSFAAICLQYNPGFFVHGKGKSETFNAFSVGYLGHARLFSNIPIYFNAKVALQYSLMSEKSNQTIEGLKVESKNTLSMLSGRVNSGIGYGFKISDADVLVMPEVGIDCICHFLGKQKKEVNIDGKNSSSKVDVFDETDMGKEYVWKSFNFGWYTGVVARFSKVVVGFSYHRALNKIARNTYMDQFDITIGTCL